LDQLTGWFVAPGLVVFNHLIEWLMEQIIRTRPRGFDQLIEWLVDPIIRTSWF
jgi:hypothetical protein